MTDGTLTITNNTAIIQKVSAKDHVAQSFAMVDPDTITDTYTAPIKKESKNEQEEITIDPSNLLSATTKQLFADACNQFKRVFGSDLPKYNGTFGKVEAVIHIPNALPPSARLKEVPWYPKTLLVELQQKMDELTEKGAMARPQDIGVNIEAMSPSFLVKKKPPSNGYRLVTSFGNLAAYVRTAPSPMPSVDTTLRRMSAWKWIITADISQAYHQLSLSKESLKYAGVCTPFKGARVYTTAAMGMPDSEVALTELTSALFGQMQMDGQVEILMDDVYIGAENPEKLLARWR